VDGDRARFTNCTTEESRPKVARATALFFSDKDTQKQSPTMGKKNNDPREFIKPIAIIQVVSIDLSNYH
jgi:hypothetical protein